MQKPYLLLLLLYLCASWIERLQEFFKVGRESILLYKPIFSLTSNWLILYDGLGSATMQHRSTSIKKLTMHQPSQGSRVKVKHWSEWSICNFQKSWAWVSDRIFLNTILPTRSTQWVDDHDNPTIQRRRKIAIKVRYFLTLSFMF